MDFELFHHILSIDSTSGKEREMALWLYDHLEAPSKELMEVGDGTLNLLLSWGTPTVVFCTHMDTVPPYIAPQFPEGTLSGGHVHPRTWEGGGARWVQVPEGDAADSGRGRSERSERSSSGESTLQDGGVVFGRGACDAKGQLFAMYTACKELEAEGCEGFALLLLSGEETGSWGAKAFSRTDFKAPFLIVGEPTDNKMVSASKGTLSYDLKFTGVPFHSGYPECGVSAVDLFHQFYTKLQAVDWGTDPVLGATTWNIGLLHSDNPQNILSPELTCRLYFRTTFVSHRKVQEWMASAGQGASCPAVQATPRGGDTPARYLTLEGFDQAPVAFGSDAPHLTGFGQKVICGPGSIKVAHRDDEHILLRDLETAIGQYKRMFAALTAAQYPAETQ